MRAILVFAIVPALIGVAASLFITETRRAALLAGGASVVFVFLATHVGDQDMAIGWLASLLVLPLPIAFAVATVAYFAGRSHRPHTGREPGA